MGIPKHYSRDIVQRCQALIGDLYPIVEKGFPSNRQFGGPLVTTFLLAIATPMIVLPIERIFKAARGDAVTADDCQVAPAFAEQVNDVLGPERRFADAPFVIPDRWSYVRNLDPFNFAEWWSNDLPEKLASKGAFAAANEAPAQRILLDLRNALAHGGVAYLDSNGQQIDSGQAAMLALASAQLKDRKVARINVLRIHQDDFFKFVMSWAEWLATPPLRNVLNEQDPFAA